MIAGRRAIPARHEFRVGTRELLVFGAVFLLVCALTFVFGLLVGREIAPGARGGARAAAPGAGAPAAGAPAVKAPAAHREERLTFYRTLTAPTADLPAVGPPTVEERIVPKDVAPSAAEPKLQERTAPEKRPTLPGGPRPEPSPRRRSVAAPVPPGTSASGTVAARTPAGGALALAPAGAPPTPVPGEPQLWTVQVSSFRSRALAEELRARLATRGYDAYLLSAATEEGRVRYRVRVGTYPTRAEAERVANDLKSERTLSPFVTPRSR